jgi:outer membrane lipoprotein-sorting protein
MCSFLLTSGCAAKSAISKVKNLANTSKDIEDFTKKADQAQKLTYTAKYDQTSSGKKDETIRIVQKPPKSLYEQGDTLLIDNGTRTITCSPDSSNNNKQQCIDVGPAGTNPTAFTAVFSAPAVLQALSVFAILPGVSVSHPSRNLAGESLDCVKITVSKDNKHVESCVTKDGVLGFYDAGDGDTFSLTSFSRSASDKDFDPPSKPQTTQDIVNQATSTSISIPTVTAPVITVPSTDDNTTSTSDTSETTDTTTP